MGYKMTEGPLCLVSSRQLKIEAEAKAKAQGRTKAEALAAIRPVPLDMETWVQKADRLQPDFDHNETVFIDYKTKVTVICRKCRNKTERLPYNHTASSGCQICYQRARKEKA